MCKAAKWWKLARNWEDSEANMTADCDTVLSPGPAESPPAEKGEVTNQPASE